MKAKISIVTLGVKDVSASKEFYLSLGFPIHTEMGEFVMFNMEGSMLSLFPKEQLYKDATIENDSKGTPPFTLAHNVSSKDDVDKTINFVREKGAKIIKEPQEVFWGGYSAYFRDPDGFLWEVAFNPFADLS